MTTAVFLVILLAAALHASWNAIVKKGGDALMTTVAITGSAAVIAAITLPFLPPPARASWPFLAASAVLSVTYYILVARTYAISDMSQSYPLMRGTAPLIVATAGTVVMGEKLTAMGWLGIAVICAGIVSMIGGQGFKVNKGTALALLNAAVIAGYTLIDGAGVRHSGSPIAYTLWIFLLTGVPMTAWALARRGPAFRAYARRNWRLGLAGGFGTIASYGLALWAMTQAPVALVAALRETAILFGAVISGVVLKERLTASRLVAAGFIALGAMVLRGA